MDEVIWQDQESGQRQALCINQSGHVPIDKSLSAVQPVNVPDFIMGSALFWGHETPPLRINVDEGDPKLAVKAPQEPPGTNRGEPPRKPKGKAPPKQPKCPSTQTSTRRRGV